MILTGKLLKREVPRDSEKDECKELQTFGGYLHSKLRNIPWNFVLKVN